MPACEHNPKIPCYHLEHIDATCKGCNRNPEPTEYIPHKSNYYKDLGAAIGELVDEKQEQYGNSFGRAGEILQILYPGLINPEQYKDMLAVVRIIDKLFRIANGDQGSESAYQDIAGYGLLGAGRPK